MRTFYGFFTAAFLALIRLQAQLEIQPLPSNPILLQHQYIKDIRLKERLIAQYGAAIDFEQARGGAPVQCINPDNDIYEDGNTAYVLSGDTIRICVNDAIFSNVTCTNCSSLLLGTASLDNGCISYVCNGWH